MDKCSKCGAELNSGSVFCLMCGTKLIKDETICKNADDSSTVEEVITEQIAESNINSNGYTDGSDVENEKKSEILLDTDNTSNDSEASKKTFLKKLKKVAPRQIDWVKWD
ncbi:MAG: zinc ribbon domain-containing protein [Clostridia bacterium]|nr:zinc ribbon domain-containing protein [Clostridia bacterium]